MGELVYRKELWTLKDRGEWRNGYSDLVEAAYAEAVGDSSNAEALCGGRPHSGMHTGSFAGSGYIHGSYRIGSGMQGSRTAANGSVRKGSFNHAGSMSSRSSSGSTAAGGILSLGYGIQLI